MKSTREIVKFSPDNSIGISTRPGHYKVEAYAKGRTFYTEKMEFPLIGQNITNIEFIDNSTVRVDLHSLESRYFQREGFGFIEISGI